ncbi:MAG TPA: dihydroorotate dehydrogenase-like protein [Vicinamibacterales bacterium]|jgi:dihydroorotate dehydrogenase (fumarate)|nr:dihydroorotate dehydrogenase-like protein [Vicinamibacterales bacterium]
MDTTTSLMGFRLPHPFLAGASPLGWDLDSVRRLEDGGCAALVLPSLFEEQITLATRGRIHHMDPLEKEWASILEHFPDAGEYALSPDEYAEHIHRVKQALHVPVIGSLNGTTGESWLTYARTIQQAGADALELNLYEVVTDLDMSGAAIEHQLSRVLLDLKRLITIPIAVKLSPFFAAFGNLARQLDRAGADALVIFNRFYQPDIDIDAVKAVPHVDLSTSTELLLRLRWTAILHGRVRPSLVITGGVATPNDGVKAVLAGADAVQIVAAILRNGPAHFTVMREGLEQWMDRHNISSLDEMKGRVSLKQTADPGAFERAHYIRTLQSWRDS